MDKSADATTPSFSLSFSLLSQPHVMLYYGTLHSNPFVHTNVLTLAAWNTSREVALPYNAPTGYLVDGPLGRSHSPLHQMPESLLFSY